MEKLCKGDGGIKVYETVDLPASDFNCLGDPLAKYHQIANSSEEYYGPEYRWLTREKYIVGNSNTRADLGDGVLKRLHFSLYRRSDNRLLGEEVRYSRGGGDGFTFGFQPSGKSCPLSSDGLTHRIFLRKNADGSSTEVPLGTYSCKTESIKRVRATLVSSKGYTDRPSPEKTGSVVSSPSTPSFGWSGNRKCPSDTGWVGPDIFGHGVAEPMGGYSFFIGEKVYRLGRRKDYKALCQKDFVYLSTGTYETNQDLIEIEKRSLVDFKLLWKGIVEIDRTFTTHRSYLVLDSVKENKSDITFSIINEDGWTEILLTAPLETGNFQ